MMMEMAREGMKQKRREEDELRKQRGEAPKEKNDSEEIIPVEQYFVFFLKFIATICPVCIVFHFRLTLSVIDNGYRFHSCSQIVIIPAPITYLNMVISI